MPLKFAENAAGYYRAPLTIRHLLDNVLQSSRQQTIHYQDRSSYTYEHFIERIDRLASCLSLLGVERGTTVAVMDWDSPRYLEAYFAIPMMGAVLQTVNVRLTPSQIAFTLAHAEANLLIVHRDFFPVIEAIRDQLPQVQKIVAIMDGADDLLPEWACGAFDALTDEAPTGFQFEDFDEDAVATTFYTSGTTGNPKGVCFTHRQIVLQALASCGIFGASDGYIGIGYRDVYMPLTPMFHVHAWGTPYMAVMLGVKQIYPGRYDAEMICRLRRTFNITYSHCVPTVLRMILDAAAQNGTNLDGWKIAIGGSALGRELFLEGQGRGLALCAGYGMSESGPTMCRARSPIGPASDADIIAARISCGFPAAMVSLMIVDEEMNPLPNDGVAKGELVVRAPWLTPCYVGDPEASAALWRGGWMHTQDIASIDPDGTLRIRDRAKDVIKSGGEWIDSIELERLIASVPEVADVSVIAVKDARWGERPFAVVVRRDSASIDLDKLNRPIEIAIAAGRITRYARLDRFTLVDVLPRTSVGKIDKRALRAEFV